MKRDFSALGRQRFDLLVCGGGIYGAWTAYDAAQRGLSVAIIDKGDWASGTSSGSSKLIHGGLRYLETYDFKLVRKALRERQILLNCGPHRIWPLRFGVPVYADSRVGRAKLGAGLMLYDMLAGLPDEAMRSTFHGRDDFLGRFAVVEDSELLGGFSYGDGQTDDARLILELIYGAQELGAICVNYCELDDHWEAAGDWRHYTVRDHLSGNGATIGARQIVYATGRWATQRNSNWCRLSKGIHLVMPPLPTDAALLLTAKSDGRIFFLIPWYGMTLLGTTDDDYQGDLNHIAIEPAEVRYLLNEANHYLQTTWTEADVVGRFAGIRAMKRSDDLTPSSASRDWELRSVDSATHYSIGGKITSAREDAATIVDTVCVGLNNDATCRTAYLPFPWTPAGDYQQWLNANMARANALGIDKESATWLMRRHGNRVDQIFSRVEMDSSLARRISATLPVIHADMLFCAEHEMVLHLDDLLRRRVPLTIASAVSREMLRDLATMVAPYLGWDEAEITREVEACARQ